MMYGMWLIIKQIGVSEVDCAPLPPSKTLRIAGKPAMHKG
jgi:hypothetical protein